MGLKSTNYESKRLSLILPHAYAMLRSLVINRDNSVRAKFVIQSDRRAAQVADEIDSVEVNFTWDRKEDVVKAAYRHAKTQTYEVWSENGESVQVNGKLFGWEDDDIND